MTTHMHAHTCMLTRTHTCTHTHVQAVTSTGKALVYATTDSGSHARPLQPPCSRLALCAPSILMPPPPQPLCTNQRHQLQPQHAAPAPATSAGAPAARPGAVVFEVCLSVPPLSGAVHGWVGHTDSPEEDCARPVGTLRLLAHAGGAFLPLTVLHQRRLPCGAGEHAVQMQVQVRARGVHCAGRARERSGAVCMRAFNSPLP